MAQLSALGLKATLHNTISAISFDREGTVAITDKVGVSATASYDVMKNRYSIFPSIDSLHVFTWIISRYEDRIQSNIVSECRFVYAVFERNMHRE